MLAEIFWNEQTIAVVMVFAVPIIAILAVFWHKLETHKSDNELKRSMVERGFTADEIERVIAAGAEKKPASQRAVT